MLRKDFTRISVAGTWGTPSRPAYTVCTPSNPGGGSGGSGGAGGGSNTVCQTVCVPYQSDSIEGGQLVNSDRYTCQTVCVAR